MSDGVRITCSLVILLAVGSPVWADHRIIEFDRDVRPILSSHCYQCHGPDQKNRQAELRLDLQADLFGSLKNHTTVVVPGETARSELYRRISTTVESEQMPPPSVGKPLTAVQIETVKRWIEQGAVWSGQWSYEPLRRPPIPHVDFSLGENPIDLFVAEQWQAVGVTPVELADATTLMRRLSFDLTGLPLDKEVAEAGAFNADSYSVQVERLLAAPQYGERMAVYWLDLVRYADSCGYHSDVEQQVWPYRDYVILAFNENLPFDQFTREQLAGDLLPEPTFAQRVATGFNRLSKATEEGGAQEQEYLAKAFSDRVRTVSGTWLAATLGCAECHDHKYDPLTTRDFYSLGAFFADIKEQGVYSGGGSHAPELSLPTSTQALELESLQRELAEVRDRLQPAMSTGLSATDEIKAEIKQLDDQRKMLESRIPRTLVTVSVAPREIRVLPRGDWQSREGAIVEPAVPAVFAPWPAAGRRLTRLDLANWLVHRDNPLTSRVFVNRLWKLFFGTGLAKTLDDLGAQGEAPVNRELLDWLAVEFIDSGWDVKHVVRLIVTSRVYRLSSIPSLELAQRDPQNRLFARQSRWRLEAEFLRDNALRVSGLLVERIGGPSVRPYQPEGYWEFLNFPTRSWQASMGADQYRRGLYTHWQRTFLHPALLAFDAPTREECTAVRTASNTPKSALALLNDPSLVEAARVFGARILREGGDTDSARLTWGWRTALSRSPDAHELKTLLTLLAAHRADGQTASRLHAEDTVATSGHEQISQVDGDLAAWLAVARTLLNLHEFTTRN